MIKTLIVDDEKLEREGIKYLLSQEECERKIFEASNGREALNILRERNRSSSYRYQNATYGRTGTYLPGQGTES